MNRAPIPPVDAPACILCAAWQSWGDMAIGNEAGTVVGRQLVGQCRAAPPTIDRNAISDPTATWPTVTADDWCGSFMQREPAIVTAERQPDGRSPDEGRPRA